MIVNANVIVKHVVPIKNGIVKHFNVNVEILSAKENLAGIYFREEKVFKNYCWWFKHLL